MSDFEYRLRRKREEASLKFYRAEKARQLADPVWGYSCNACGYHPRSTSMWCDVGCGSDYNRMTKVLRPEHDPEQSVT